MTLPLLIIAALAAGLSLGRAGRYVIERAPRR